MWKPSSTGYRPAASMGVRAWGNSEKSREDFAYLRISFTMQHNKIRDGIAAVKAGMCCDCVEFGTAFE